MADRRSFAHIDVIHSKTDLGNRCNHNLKQGERLKKSHVNSEQIENNRMLIGSWEDDYYKLAVERITNKKYNEEEWDKYKKEHPSVSDIRYEDGRKIRSDAVLAVEIVMPYPGEMSIGKNDEQYPKDNERYENWISDSMEYIKNKFGEQNVLNAVLHVDESVPHIHVIATPVVEKEKGLRIDYHNFIDGKRGLSQFHTELAKATGFERGVEGLYANYDDLKKYKALCVKTLAEELPEPKEGQTAKEYKNEVDELYKTASVRRQEAEHKSKILSKAADVANKVQEENRKLEEELQKLRDQTILLQKQLQKEKRDKEIERLGLGQIEDAQIRETYLAIKNSIDALGKQQLKNLGLNYVDLDNDGIDDRDDTFVDADHDGIDDRSESELDE